jgi:hypothetical protein
MQPVLLGTWCICVCVQVFLAIADQAVPLHTPAVPASTTSAETGGGRPSPVSDRPESTSQATAAAAAGADVEAVGDGLVHGAALYWQQFKALFVKRMLSAR